MKKTVSILFGLCLFPMLFSLNFETRVNLGYEYSVFTETGQLPQTGKSGTSTMYNDGFHLGMSSFANNSNFGFFLATDYIFPSKIVSTTPTLTVAIDSKDLDIAMIFSLIIGFSYKIDIDKLSVVLSLGPHAALTGLGQEYNFALLNYSFGFAGQIDAQYFISNWFYLNIGSIFSYDFYHISEVTTPYYESKDSGLYNFTSIRPFLSLGFRIKETIQ